jgi:hypothetical protein
MFRLSYFTIVCYTNEYKMMGQGSSLGQLYNVHNKIKISRKHWLGLCIYYDTFRIVTYVKEFCNTALKLSDSRSDL